MNRPSNNLYEFGSFRINVIEKQLLCKGERVSLTPKAFDTLIILVEHSGEILEKEELMKLLWPDSCVEENNLSQNIHALRRALGDDSEKPHYIQTLPRRGYRFLVDVRRIRSEAPVDRQVFVWKDGSRRIHIILLLMFVLFVAAAGALVFHWLNSHW
jgi:DNA-binding winged helix-turn-helix (wHTH) protein